jgi:hypothetical protein
MGLRAQAPPLPKTPDQRRAFSSAGVAAPFLWVGAFSPSAEEKHKLGQGRGSYARAAAAAAKAAETPLPSKPAPCRPAACSEVEAALREILVDTPLSREARRRLFESPPAAALCVLHTLKRSRADVEDVSRWVLGGLRSRDAEADQLVRLLLSEALDALIAEGWRSDDPRRICAAMEFLDPAWGGRLGSMYRVFRGGSFCDQAFRTRVLEPFSCELQRRGLRLCSGSGRVIRGTSKLFK